MLNDILLFCFGIAFAWAVILLGINPPKEKTETDYATCLVVIILLILIYYGVNK